MIVKIILGCSSRPDTFDKWDRSWDGTEAHKKVWVWDSAQLRGFGDGLWKKKRVSSRTQANIRSTYFNTKINNHYNMLEVSDKLLIKQLIDSKNLYFSVLSVLKLYHIMKTIYFSSRICIEQLDWKILIIIIYVPELIFYLLLQGEFKSKIICHRLYVKILQFSFDDSSWTRGQLHECS